MAEQQLQETTTSEVNDMLHVGMQDLLANATLAINKEADMNEGRTQTDRPSPTSTTATVQDTTIKTINRLQADLGVAEAEADYWATRCNDIRLALSALHALIDKLHENDPKTPMAADVLRDDLPRTSGKFK